jgi:propionyl-CoA carboxylase alpha chain
MNPSFNLTLSTALVSLGFLAAFLLALASVWWITIGRFRPRKVRPANLILSPASGVVVSVAVQPGDRVAFGQELCEFEIDGHKNAVRAARPGEVGAVRVAAGDIIARGQVIIEYRMATTTVGANEPGAPLD